MRRIITLFTIIGIFTLGMVPQVYAGEEDVPCPMSIEEDIPCPMLIVEESLCTLSIDEGI